MWMQAGRPAAAACVTGEGNLRGSVSFYPKKCGVLVIAQVSGLPENGSGFFSFHIHEGFSCSGEGYSSTGAHFNPFSVDHPLHAGDLPPLLSRQGKAFLAVMTDRFSLPEVIGRTVVIHEDADDFHTQPAGNAGRKIACGVIRRIGY